jgi:hypothetical protein
MKDLDKLNVDIADSYSKGNINEKHYERLNNEISILYDKIFRRNIESLMKSTKGNITEQWKTVEDKIEIAHSEQKFTETQFNLLRKKISDVEKRDANNELDEK